MLSTELVDAVSALVLLKKNCLSALCLFSETEGRKSEEREEAYAEAEVGEAEASEVESSAKRGRKVEGEGREARI